jgi:iron-sulfur cluster assembly protein
MPRSGGKRAGSSSLTNPRFPTIPAPSGNGPFKRVVKEVHDMPINVTDKAAREFTALLDKEGKTGAAIRVWVAGLGCHGFRYGMGLEENEPQQSDSLFESNGVRVVVDSESLKYLEGSRIDFVDDSEEGGFSIDNPNPAPEQDCDCGSGGCGGAHEGEGDST